MKYVRDIKSFYYNLGAYLVTMVILMTINLMTLPGYLWFLWATLGWGLSVLGHGLAVFEVWNLFGSEWEKKQIQKRLRRK